MARAHISLEMTVTTPESQPTLGKEPPPGPRLIPTIPKGNRLWGNSSALGSVQGLLRSHLNKGRWGRVTLERSIICCSHVSKQASLDSKSGSCLTHSASCTSFYNRTTQSPVATTIFPRLSPDETVSLTRAEGRTVPC